MKRKLLALLPVMLLVAGGYTVTVNPPAGAQQSGAYTYGKG